MAISVVSSQASDKGKFNISPKTNEGKKWRIGCYGGGEYIDYRKSLEVTVKSLMDLGWIKKKDMPLQEGPKTLELWKWLSTEIQSDYIEFVMDAHYNAKWDDSLRKKTVARLIRRLSKKKDIDLVFSLGTWAGQDLANNEHDTPIIGMSISDPLTSGIVKGIDDSGYDHVLARLDPFRDERQIRIFHDIVGFKRLGIAFEDTVMGRSYVALDKAEKIAKERGFEIVKCFTKHENI